MFNIVVLKILRCSNQEGYLFISSMFNILIGASDLLFALIQFRNLDRNNQLAFFVLVSLIFEWSRHGHLLDPCALTRWHVAVSEILLFGGVVEPSSLLEDADDVTGRGVLDVQLGAGGEHT